MVSPLKGAATAGNQSYQPSKKFGSAGELTPDIMNKLQSEQEGAGGDVKGRAKSGYVPNNRQGSATLSGDYTQGSTAYGTLNTGVTGTNTNTLNKNMIMMQ